MKQSIIQKLTIVTCLFTSVIFNDIEKGPGLNHANAEANVIFIHCKFLPSRNKALASPRWTWKRRHCAKQREAECKQCKPNLTHTVAGRSRLSKSAPISEAREPKWPRARDASWAEQPACCALRSCVRSESRAHARSRAPLDAGAAEPKPPAPAAPPNPLAQNQHWT